jgi:hypothetical protein
MNSPLKKYLLPALVIPSAVFGISTLPLAVLSSQQVAVQVQDEPVFQGQLREIASPYLVLATAVSAAIGVAGVAVIGWKQSTSKSAELEEQLSEKQQALKHKEVQLEELKLSAALLTAQGLDSFVELESAVEPLQAVVLQPIEEPQPLPSIVPLEAPMQAEEPIERPRLAVVPNSAGQVIEFPTTQPPIHQIQNQVEQIKAQLEMLQSLQLEMLQNTLTVQSVRQTNVAPVVASEPMVEITEALPTLPSKPIVEAEAIAASVQSGAETTFNIRMSDLHSPKRPRTRLSAVAV